MVYYLFNPSEHSFFPKCPFRVLTGFDCPGCGSQRAAHALLHADVVGAIGHNLLLVISMPLLVVHWGYKIASLIKKQKLQWPLLYHRATPKVVFVIVVAFWIIRNTTIYPFNN
ncbi:DUF2752 domain-containing protein [Mucilaginibacter hurinus]